MQYQTDQHGFADITVTATDDGELNAEQDFRVTVKAVNDKPTATIDTTTRVSTTITFTGHGADVEDGDQMAKSALVWKIALTSAPGDILGTISGESTGEFTNLDSSASYTLTLTVTDIGASTGVDSEVFAGTIFQDDFEAETLRAQSLSNWTVTPATNGIDVIGDDGFGDFFANVHPLNGMYVDMAGCTNGTITSPSLTLPAGTYQFSFKIGNNPVNEFDINRLQVTLGARFDENFDAQAALTLITRTFNVPTSTTASLVFQETGTIFNDIRDCGGTVIDDVLLTLVSAT